MEEGGKCEHKAAILENQMLEVRGEGKDSPKSDCGKLGRRQMKKNREGQREGSPGTWRTEGSTLICTFSTDVASETSIMTHYVTAKDWEPYLVCMISVNSYNLKKEKSLKRKQIPWSEVLCLMSQEFHKWWSLRSLHDIVLSLNKCLLPQSSLYKGVGTAELGQPAVGPEFGDSGSRLCFQETWALIWWKTVAQNW